LQIHSKLVVISGKSPRLLLCVHHCVSSFGAAVYLPLSICRCVSAAVYPPLCICHCVYCISCCSSATVYPLLWIYRCVPTTVYIVLCILNYLCISAAVNMYPDLVLYTWLYICHCIYICHGISKSATVSTVLYICHGTMSTMLYICYYIFHYVSTTIYPTLVSTAVYPPLWICCCGSAAVDLPLYPMFAPVRTVPV